MSDYDNYNARRPGGGNNMPPRQYQQQYPPNSPQQGQQYHHHPPAQGYPPRQPPTQGQYSRQPTQQQQYRPQENQYQKPVSQEHQTFQAEKLYATDHSRSGSSSSETLGSSSPKIQPQPQQPQSQPQQPQQSSQIAIREIREKPDMDSTEINVSTTYNASHYISVESARKVPGSVDPSVYPPERPLIHLTSLEQIWEMPINHNGFPTWKVWIFLGMFLYSGSFILLYLLIRAIQSFFYRLVYGIYY